MITFDEPARFLATILRGAPPRWPDDAPDEQEVLEAAVEHSVAPLVSQALVSTSGTPRFILEGLAAAARAETVLAVLRERELRPVLEALTAGGVRLLVIKGAHLAQTVYESPELRPRRDTDLLIDETDRDRTRAILERLGYVWVPHISGALVMPQFHFRREDRSGAVHQLDVHWRLAVPQPFSALPRLSDLWDASMPIPAEGPAARWPSPEDALLVACAHRAAHHSDGGALIWIVDVQRVAERLSDSQADRFVECATRSRICAVAGQALSLARDMLGARLSPPLMALAEMPIDRGEATAQYLSPVTAMRSLALDLRALDGWRPRARLLREHLLPPPAYMRTAYAPESRWPLPALYVSRAVTGAAQWLFKGDDR